MEIPGGELKGTSKTDVFDVPFVFKCSFFPYIQIFPITTNFFAPVADGTLFGLPQSEGSKRIRDCIRGIIGYRSYNCFKRQLQRLTFIVKRLDKRLGIMFAAGGLRRFYLQIGIVF